MLSKYKCLLAIAPFLAAVALSSVPARADGLDATFSHSYSQATDGVTYDSHALSAGAGPADFATSISVDGNTSSTRIQLDGSSSTSTGSFSTTGEFGNNGAYGYSLTSLLFIADGACDYELSGSYWFDGGEGRGYLRARLRDETLGSFVFDNTQESQGVDGESFSLGGTDGNWSNFLSGSLTGTLIDGHHYKFEFTAFVHNYPEAGNPLRGGADVTIRLQGLEEPVPEPGTFALLGLGLAGAALRRRLRR